MKIRDITEEFNIKILPPVGSGKMKEPGTVVDLIKAIPYLIQSGYLPPMKILNTVFSEGKKDAGMSGGCEWEPFQITVDSFSQLIDKVTGPDGEKVIYSEPPDWVEDMEDFQIWVLDIKHGVPWKEHKKLNDAYNESKRKTVEARNENERERLFLKEIEEGVKLSDYINKYLIKGT